MKNKHPVLRRFMRRKVSVVAAAVLILFVLIAILGPLVWQVDPLKQSVMKKYGPMTVQHPLGTDKLPATSSRPSCSLSIRSSSPS